MVETLKTKEALAAVVVITTPMGIPVVRDLSKHKSFWKFPGGKGEEGETPEECAIREILEEVGLDISGMRLFLIYQEDRGTHTFYAFQVSLPDLSGIRRRGNEGEEVGVFSGQEILEMQDFLPQHRIEPVERILRVL